MSNLISVDALQERIDDPALIVVDCRFELADPQAGRRGYEAGHIPGSVHFDLEQDLSAPVQSHGGRHPLPDLDAFVDKLQSAGIGDETNVVAYDSQNGAMAARFWWMLRYLGHDRVQVLDGGFPAWERAGLPLSKDVPEPAARRFTPRQRDDIRVDMAGVKERLAADTAVVLDSRAVERYRGEVEPIDPVAGHIPGAVNLPWLDNVQENGLFLDVAAREQRFAPFSSAREYVVYCGSGVTACVNVLMMQENGLSNTKLYVGSWSDWCSYEENPIASGADSD